MLNFRGLIVLAVVSWLFVGSVQAQIPVEQAYGNLPAIESVALSEDGNAFVSIQRSDSERVVVQTLTGEILVNIDVSDRRPTRVFWASPDHIAIESLVLSSRFTLGQSHFPQLDLVNIRTKGVARALRSANTEVLSAIFDSWPGTYRGQPVLFVSAVNVGKAKPTQDVYRVDLNTGRGHLHVEGLEDTSGYLVRNDGEVAARIAYSGALGRLRLSASTGTGQWREIYEVTSPIDTPRTLGFGEDPKTVLVSTLEGDRYQTRAISLSDGSVAKDLSGDRDILGAMYDDQQRLVGWAYAGQETEYEFIQPQLKAAMELMSKGLADKTLKLASSSADYQVVVVRSEGPSDAGTFYLYDSRAGSVSLVGRAYPLVAPDGISPISAINYVAADGLSLMAYLTLPQGRDAKNLPLIVFPHGGPQSRDRLEFDWWGQAMASRGYAVLQPQFRGSSGFGDALTRAGHGEWGRKMQTDLSDGVRHLVAQGTVDPARVCIVGASYGGYAALNGVATEPDVYRCAVAVAGVSDLPRMLLDEARSSGFQADARNPTMRYWTRFMGAERTNTEALAALSPSRHADQIVDPVLLIHGRDDTVVPFVQSQIMADNLRAAGKQVELAPLDGEDHWMSFGSTRRAMLQKTLAFLEAHNPPR